jgi:hypothetical protein
MSCHVDCLGRTGEVVMHCPLLTTYIYAHIPIIINPAHTACHFFVISLHLLYMRVSKSDCDLAFASSTTLLLPQSQIDHYTAVYHP